VKKIFLIGLIVCVLAVSGIGAAYAAGMTFGSVGILSLGTTPVTTVEADYVGFHLVSAAGQPVTVDGVYLSLDTTIGGTNAVSVSLRDVGGNSLAWYAANNVSWSEAAIQNLALTPTGSTLPTADQVYYVKVTVATNSNYNLPFP